MIFLKELLHGRDFSALPVEHQDNLAVLLFRLNKIEGKYGRPMTVTSGYRSMEDHLRIYRAKGITEPNRIPMKSRHLIGAAADIADPSQELQRWVLGNLSLVREAELWCEVFQYTKSWVHFQSVPYASWTEGRSIFFKP